MADDDVAADGLTPAEQAYFESGGEKTDGLLTENIPAPMKEDKTEASKPTVVAESAPSATDAADEEDEEDDALAKDPKATVPYQKYKRELKKLRGKLTAAEKSGSEQSEGLKKQLAELNERFARGDERLRLLTEAMNAPQPAEDEDAEPDPNEDIIGWAQWSQRQRARDAQTIADLRGGVQQTQTTIQESAADAQMRQDYVSDAAAFAGENRDFGAAYDFLISARAGMLEDQGYTPAEIKKTLWAEERGLVRRAMERKERPAAAIYALAKRMGYRAAPANGARAAHAHNGNGTSAPARVPSVTEEIERIAKGQQANKSLSDSGGAASELTVDALANMSDKEFEALYASKKGNIERLLGKMN